MAIRIHELHPTLVHFPIALFPTAIAADAIGAVTGRDDLMQIGAKLMPVAVAATALSGVAGLVAQESVKPEGRAQDLLTTHRNLNLGLLAATSVLAAIRAGRQRPSPGYLLGGLAAVGALMYSAYLGGKMVYEFGVGVRRAGGLKEDEAPEIRRDTLGRAARVAGMHVVHGVKHSAEHLAHGDIVPALSEH
jgi:uncharacterized membrane protein